MVFHSKLWQRRWPHSETKSYTLTNRYRRTKKRRWKFVMAHGSRRVDDKRLVSWCVALAALGARAPDQYYHPFDVPYFCVIHRNAIVAVKCIGSPCEFDRMYMGMGKRQQKHHHKQRIECITTYNNNNEKWKENTKSKRNWNKNMMAMAAAAVTVSYKSEQNNFELKRKEMKRSRIHHRCTHTDADWVFQHFNDTEWVWVYVCWAHSPSARIETGAAVILCLSLGRNHQQSWNSNQCFHSFLITSMATRMNMLGVLTHELLQR